MHIVEEIDSIPYDLILVFLFWTQYNPINLLPCLPFILFTLLKLFTLHLPETGFFPVRQNTLNVHSCKEHWFLPCILARITREEWLAQLAEILQEKEN